MTERRPAAPTPTSCCDCATERGLRYLLTAPGDPRTGPRLYRRRPAIDGIDPADPYELLRTIEDGLRLHRPPLATIPALARSLGLSSLRPPPPPPQEAPSQWRRLMNGLRHTKDRDAAAIRHHYDVSNHFYEMVLGPSMAYTCACYPTADATLEQAQEHKFDLVAASSAWQPGMRLLDVGCGWGGMIRHAVKHYGVTAIGVTLSRNQASWAAEASRRGWPVEPWPRCGSGTIATCRRRTSTRSVPSASPSTSVCATIRPTSRFLAAKVRVGGRLLNHCITRSDNRHPGIPSRGFINRYVFPDGELTGSGSIAVGHAGQRVRDPPRGEPARALRSHAPRLVRQPECELGRPASPRPGADRQGVGPVHGRVATVVRTRSESSCTSYWA